MVEGRKVQRVRILALLLALIVLGVLILRVGGMLDRYRSAGEAETPSPTAAADAAPATRTPLPTEEATDTSPSATLDLFAPTTPADQWANHVLDQALPAITQPVPLDSGFAWWQSSSARGELSLSEDRIAIAGQALELDPMQGIDILVPDLQNPSQLSLAGSVEWEGEALVLAAAGDDPAAPRVHWLLSDASPTLAIIALLNQADARDLKLTAAYTESFGGQAQLVLTGATATTVTVTPAAEDAAVPDPTPTASLTPVVAWTATPTRVPEAFLGQVIAAKLDPVIDVAESFHPTATTRYVVSHPWAGILAWTETGPTIGGRAVGVGQAEELNLYALQEDDPSGRVASFLLITYDGSVTRLPDDQLLFQEQRMEEVLFWIVRHAAERGGQMVVAYDDFGVRQAITVVGFRPLTGSGP